MASGEDGLKTTPKRSGSAESDAALMARVAKGDAVAARTLIDAHAPLSLALARRLLRDGAEAEDVAQEAMLRLWRAAPDWRDDGARVSTWLHRVTSNLCFDRLRRKRSVGLDEAPEPVDETPSAAAAMAAEDAASALRAAVDALPDRQRDAVRMRHFDGRSNPEIAAALQVSVEAVESLLARGRRALKAQLASRRDALLE